jgi:inosine-uridine nucleoside N-ribohydrolase
METTRAFRWVLVCCGTCILCFPVSAQTRAIPATPVPLIFDTDIGNDVDDVLALGMIHALQSRGECRLLAVTITKDHEQCAPFVDAVNTFYGRGDIAIGVCRSGITPEQSRFTGLAHQQDEGRARYPHDLNSGRDAPDAVSVLRQALAAQPEHSVVICQVGFSTNLAALLDSPPDTLSPLNGQELVRSRVRLLSVMAGAFAPIDGKVHLEYNVVQGHSRGPPTGHVLANTHRVQRIRSRPGGRLSGHQY